MVAPYRRPEVRLHISLFEGLKSKGELGQSQLVGYGIGTAALIANFNLFYQRSPSTPYEPQRWIGSSLEVLYRYLCPVSCASGESLGEGAYGSRPAGRPIIRQVSAYRLNWRIDHMPFIHRDQF
jgi:hypothetical protein